MGGGGAPHNVNSVACFNTKRSRRGFGFRVIIMLIIGTITAIHAERPYYLCPPLTCPYTHKQSAGWGKNARRQGLQLLLHSPHSNLITWSCWTALLLGHAERPYYLCPPRTRPYTHKQSAGWGKTARWQGALRAAALTAQTIIILMIVMVMLIVGI